MTIKLRFSYIFYVIASFLILTGCNNDSDAPKLPTEKTILVYIASNNSLGDYGCDTKDLNEMKTAVQNGALGNNNRLLIFHAPLDNSQTLYEMLPNGAMNVIKKYDGSQYAVSSNLMLEVFNDAKQYAPSQSNGLILWSHALGWTQNGMTDDGPDGISPKTWGEDRGRTMNISTLARVLEASQWDWVYFDCCFMGSVEVAYQLRNAVPRFVASASEIPLDGMPYNLNLPLLFQKESDLVGAAKNTYEDYDNRKGELRTCTIGVFEVAGMNELANTTAEIYGKCKYTPPTEFYNLPLDVYVQHLFFDFGVYVDGLSEKFNIDQSLIDKWHHAYNQVVRYHAATPMLWSSIDLAKFTGLSTFIPRSISQLSYRNYDTLEWYKDVASLIFNNL